MQGGLEIPVKVMTKMDCSPQKKDTLFKYESLVEQYYRKVADGKFEDITTCTAVLTSLESDADTSKETVDDEAEQYEPELRPEHNETECDSSVVLS